MRPFALFVILAATCGVQQADWPTYGCDPGGTRYSSLRQINHDNVKDQQYVVIAAGRHGKMRAKLGDYAVAFALS
ncbi:MAG TPA: hypothetical protein VFA54_07180 [Bryobacterales bacterium]|jgi:glucose dehydrogenase|nr:hypothetical protein [Bryobacterales bacterium]